MKTSATTLLSILALSGAELACAQTVYHDFGGPTDISAEAQMFFNREAPDWSGIWYINSKYPLGFYENSTDFLWTKTPENAADYVDSRGIIFRKHAKLYIKINDLPTSGTLYLSIRYKDNIRHGSRPGVPLWSNSRTFLGTIGGLNDHRWKTTTLAVDAADLEIVNGHFKIRLADNYSDQMAGELNIDKAMLATQPYRGELGEDAPGLWPPIQASNKRFADLAKTNEYIPGQGAFFPYGMYLTVGLITDGGSATSAGFGAKDTWQILENAHINTAVIHGWGQNWHSSWKTWPNQAPWASPGIYVEPGLDEMLIQAQAHNIKIIPNFLTDTRAVWIAKKTDGAPQMLEELADSIGRNANHPALLGWNPVDEWDHENPAYAKPHLFTHQLYKICKDNSPNRPVFMSLMGFGRELGWQVAGEEADFLGVDRYFDDSRDLAAGAAEATQYLDEMRAVYGDKKAIISIVHFVGQLKNYNGVVRAPNETEVLFQAYYSIAHGAQGLLYFKMNHPDKAGIPGLESAWDGFYRLGDELFGPEGIAAALIAPSKTIDIMGEMGLVRSSNPNIDFILKETADGEQILITVNMSESTQQTTFTINDLGGGTIPVRFEERSVGAGNGQFSDSFARFERHIYNLGKSGETQAPNPPRSIGLRLISP